MSDSSEDMEHGHALLEADREDDSLPLEDYASVRGQLLRTIEILKGKNAVLKAENRALIYLLNDKLEKLHCGLDQAAIKLRNLELAIDALKTRKV